MASTDNINNNVMDVDNNSADNNVISTSRVNIQFQPSTPRQESRRLTRGDFGLTTQPNQRYPQYSTYNTLSQLINNIDTLPYCTGEPTVPGQIPAELETAVANVPAEQRCLASVRYFSNRLLSDQKKLDRRRVRLPKFGQPEIDFDANYVRLDVLDKAKKHLDKARQMYISGKSNIAQGIELRNTSRINRGRALQYSVRADNRQLPKENAHSALYNLWQAYRYIRDYEMNPPPPLNADRTMNADRVALDDKYRFIMGTMRLEPNRLGIGSEARRIWRQENTLDGNYYGAAEQEAAAEDRGYSDLYANVPSMAVRGPERVQTLLNWLETQPPDMPIDQFPASDRLVTEMGLTNTPEWTDAARALQNIHQNFVPPRVIPLSQAALPEPFQPPPPMRFRPYASLDEPYPLEPDADGWPFDNVDRPSADYIPVFLPTGESIPHIRRIRNNNNDDNIINAEMMVDDGPPYRFLGDADPPLGVPDDRVRPRKWDARVAAEILASYTGRLQQVSARHALTRRAEESRVRGSEDPDYQPPSTPLQYWTRGQLVYDYVRIPGTEYRFEQQQQQGAPPEPATSTRILGIDRNIYVQQTTPTLEEIVNTSDQARMFHVENLYPLGIAPLDVPRTTDYRQLPQQRDSQIRMLMHALFLLAAPLNAWMKAHLPERLWTREPPLASRDPGSLTFGASAPGDGYFRRTNQNITDPTRKGWRGYLNVFSMPPEGGIRGRTFQIFPPAAAAAIEDENAMQVDQGDQQQRPERPADFLTNGVPVGPFQLDPQFGQSPDHIPGNSYKYDSGLFFWVIRTNQMTVMNENTWGLDWY